MASLSLGMLTAAPTISRPSRDAHAPNAGAVAGEAMKAQDQATRVASAVGETHHAHADFATAKSVISDLDLAWIEEPIVYDHLDGYARLAADRKTPIQIGETFYGPLPRTARPIDASAGAAKRS
jgi:Enolase C-terminal domain-like